MIQYLLNKFISYCINNENNDKPDDNLVNISNKNSTNDMSNNENENLLSEPILNTNKNSSDLQCIHGRYNFMEPCELCNETLKNKKKMILNILNINDNKNK